jgi:hypothetical protein
MKNKSLNIKEDYTMITKRIFMDEEELRELEIRLSNDYIGEIMSANYKTYLDDCYEVIIRFDSKDDLKTFCENYGYETSRVGWSDMLHKQGIYD